MSLKQVIFAISLLSTASVACCCTYIAEETDGVRHDRHLEIASSHSKCSEELHDLYLHTDFHLSLLAVPSNPDSGCETVLLHNDKSGKAMQVPSQETLDKFLEDSFDLESTYSLLELQIAHSKAVSVDESTYDIIDSNCGKYILSMVRLLQIPVTILGLEYVTLHLLENGKVATLMRESPHLLDLGLTDEEIANDEVLVSAVVLHSLLSSSE